MKRIKKFSRFCAVLPGNGALFFLSALAVCRGQTVVSFLTAEYASGFEPYFFLFSSVLLLLAAGFCLTGTIMRRKRCFSKKFSSHAGILFLFAFVLLPMLPLAIVPWYPVLLFLFSLIWIPVLFRHANIAAPLLGCAASAVILLFPAVWEMTALTGSILFLLLLIPSWKDRIYAGISVSVLMAAGHYFLPQICAGEQPLPPIEKETQKTFSAATMQNLYHLNLLAYAEYGDIPDHYFCLMQNGQKHSSPASIVISVLMECAGDQDPVKFVRNDPLRAEHTSKTFRKKEYNTNGKKTAKIFLFDPGEPKNFRTNYLCTENFFQKMKKDIAPETVVGFLLPCSSPAYSASVLSAVQRTFRNTVLFFFPSPMVLASDSPLTADPEILDRRAMDADLYEHLYSPHHLLTLALPCFQDPVREATMLDKASRAVPNRQDHFLLFPNTEIPAAAFISFLIRNSMLIFGISVLFYLIFRYIFSGKPENKILFRSAEAGFLFVTGTLLCVIPYFRDFDPVPETGMLIFFAIVSVSTAWNILFCANNRNLFLFQVLLPAAALVFITLYPAPHLWMLTCTAIFLGPPFMHAMLNRDDGTNLFSRSFSPASWFAGAAWAMIIMSSMFFVNGGMFLTALTAILIFITRRNPGIE